MGLNRGGDKAINIVKCPVLRASSRGSICEVFRSFKWDSWKVENVEIVTRIDRLPSGNGIVKSISHVSMDVISKKSSVNVSKVTT